MMLLVLILVLMEDGLGQTLVDRVYNALCLNPCFNGRWSRTVVGTTTAPTPQVLILVLMEDGLGQVRRL